MSTTDSNTASHSDVDTESVRDEDNGSSLTIKDNELEYTGPDGRKITYELQPEAVQLLSGNEHALEHTLDFMNGLQVLMDLGTNEPALMCVIPDALRGTLSEILPIAARNPMAVLAVLLNVASGERPFSTPFAI